MALQIRAAGRLGLLSPAILAAVLFWLRAVPFEVPSDRELFLRGRVEC